MAIPFRTLALAALLLAYAPAHAGLPAAIEAYDQGDYATAFAESRSAAETGDPTAQYMLGYLYARGEGVAADLVLAWKWFALAAGQGDEIAADWIDRLSRRMSADQLAEAAALAEAAIPTAE